MPDERIAPDTPSDINFNMIPILNKSIISKLILSIKQGSVWVTIPFFQSRLKKHIISIKSYGGLKHERDIH